MAFAVCRMANTWIAGIGTGQDRLPVPIVASEDLGMHMTEKPTWDRITLSKRSQ